MKKWDQVDSKKTYLKMYIKIPLIVGGGIHSPSSAFKLIKSGADYIVSGTKIENLPPLNELHNFTKAIHTVH